MNDFGLKIYTLLFGKLAGVDEYGNKYYQSWRNMRDFSRPKRWVIYKGDAEPSKIPHKWFNWIHYQMDEVPLDEKAYKWQRAHEPNLTGTKHAYYPKGHALGEARRSKSIGDYESWNPNT